jgi:hypothetical protein
LSILSSTFAMVLGPQIRWNQCGRSSVTIRRNAEQGTGEEPATAPSLDSTGSFIGLYRVARVRSQPVPQFWCSAEETALLARSERWRAESPELPMYSSSSVSLFASLLWYSHSSNTCSACWFFSIARFLSQSQACLHSAAVGRIADCEQCTEEEPSPSIELVSVFIVFREGLVPQFECCSDRSGASLLRSPVRLTHIGACKVYKVEWRFGGQSGLHNRRTSVRATRAVRWHLHLLIR